MILLQNCLKQVKNIILTNMINPKSMQLIALLFFFLQGQMGVTGLPSSDFVLYSRKGITVERIEFDANLWQRMLSKLTQFYTIYIVPELFTERIKRQMKLYQEIES